MQHSCSLVEKDLRFSKYKKNRIKKSVLKKIRMENYIIGLSFSLENWIEFLRKKSMRPILANAYSGKLLLGGSRSGVGVAAGGSRSGSER